MRAHSRQVIDHIHEVQTLNTNRDSLIMESWQRCQNHYQLDPSVLQQAVVLSSSELKPYQDEVEDLLHIARLGIEALYQQIHQSGYVVLLTNEHGITVDFIGDRTFDNQLRYSGLYLGADWHEQHAGTCAVGTCIQTKQPIIVHQTDHFDASHISLTCSAAPVFAPDGRLRAVLDISALHSPENKKNQYMALKMVQIFAERIERSYFLKHFRDQLIFSFGYSPDFMDVTPEHLLATNEQGIIIGFNQRFAHEIARCSTILGQCITHFFDISLEQLLSLAVLPSFQRIIRTRQHQQAVFVQIRRPDQKLAGISDARKPHNPLSALHGGDPLLEKLSQRLLRLMNSRVNLILGGETGTGKEFLARMIHQSSIRADKPFIAVNCAALPEGLIESELFGYGQGAFTGSKKTGHTGLIEQANGGTLFLDEIGDMPLLLQSRLLRVLAEKELYPLGSSKKISLDLHVISATHQDLKNMIRCGAFRADLYYRLSGAEFILPPLRQRKDFDWLLQTLLHALQSSVEQPTRLASDTIARLCRYSWPGNIRELKNLLSYLVALYPNHLVQVDDLPEDAFKEEITGLAATVPALQVQVANNVEYSAPLSKEAHDFSECLQRYHWNVSAVARELGVARMTVYRRMKRLGIAPPNWLT